MRYYTPCCDVRVDDDALRCPACASRVTLRPTVLRSQPLRIDPPAPVNTLLHVPAHKQTRPSAAPAQIVDTEWHALARIAA